MSKPEPERLPPRIKARGLVRIYADGNVHALRGVDLSIDQGESVAITGPSGCGKSTLLHLLGGLDRPTEGEVDFDGKPLDSLDLDEYRAHRVGFVFQSFHLLPTLSALENVQIPMFETNLRRSDRVARATRLLGEVGLAHRKNHRSTRLSVGERQRVAIARALANDPQLLLADEPTGNLDSHNEIEILTLLDHLRKDRGLTMVLVTHSPEVAQHADREIRLRDGKVVG